MVLPTKILPLPNLKLPRKLKTVTKKRLTSLKMKKSLSNPRRIKRKPRRRRKRRKRIRKKRRLIKRIKRRKRRQRKLSRQKAAMKILTTERSSIYS